MGMDRTAAIESVIEAREALERLEQDDNGCLGCGEDVDATTHEGHDSNCEVAFSLDRLEEIDVELHKRDDADETRRTALLDAALGMEGQAHGYQDEAQRKVVAECAAYLRALAGPEPAAAAKGG